jgi:hypothetical protein
MAAAEERTPEQVRSEIEQRRDQLAGAVDRLRDELGEATNVTEKLRAKLPVVAAGTAAVGFVLAGGIGSTMRYFARRSREHHPPERLRLGRWSLSERD